MRWDEVERECVILAAQYYRLSNTWKALGQALHRERKFGTNVSGQRALREVLEEIRFEAGPNGPVVAPEEG